MDAKDFYDCALQLIGRGTIPPERVREIIGSRKKQIRAFNLCDGKRTLREIATKANIDIGNLSRTTTRWREQGILFEIGEGRDSRLLHIYPLPQTEA